MQLCLIRKAKKLKTLSSAALSNID